MHAIFSGDSTVQYILYYLLVAMAIHGQPHPFAQTQTTDRVYIAISSLIPQNHQAWKTTSAQCGMELLLSSIINIMLNY